MNPIEKLIRESVVIAIVGLSDNPNRDSYVVADYLKKVGYDIIPVNPNIKEWNGIMAHSSLSEIEEKIDIVDIFRRSEFVEEVVDDALKMKHKPKAVWMQLGIENKRAAEKAQAAGIEVVMNRCLKIEHEKIRNKIKK